MPGLVALFEERPQVVVNLAAQAGVRYSLENPAAYIQSNLVGFGNLLEDAGITTRKIWCTPPAVRSMAVIAICLS